VLTGSGDGSVQWQEVQCKDADNALIQLLADYQDGIPDLENHPAANLLEFLYLLEKPYDTRKNL